MIKRIGLSMTSTASRDYAKGWVVLLLSVFAFLHDHAKMANLPLDEIKKSTEYAKATVFPRMRLRMDFSGDPQNRR